MNRALICIGSNSEHAFQTLTDTIKKIEEKTALSRFSSIYKSDPEEAVYENLYTNCVGYIETKMSYEDMTFYFKLAEEANGRTPECKIRGIVPLDIDILTWNDEIKKREDLGKSYVKTGLALLSE